ncbi:MAG: DNA/RNA nuclease SfsA [Gammaproteobacteria bacterium]|nr:MAG: DNA/RNA nuclease SfsA [Gammaproteobacteria bacterium]
MQFNSLVRGVLVKRYKRFLADVELADGSVITAHCPNTGAMTGCGEPGSAVWLSKSDDPKRKYAHTWELVSTPQGLACIASAKANTVVAEALAAGGIAALAGFDTLRREVKYGSGSRADFLLEASATGDRVYIEVKSVTLCAGDGLGLFPDAVSIRARKHLAELQEVIAPGVRAMLLYCVFHQGIDRVAPALAIDPDYGAALAAARAAGVEVVAYGCDISTRGISLASQLPVVSG